MREKTESEQSTRDRIMQAAIDIMREVGDVEKVTIRGIAKRAGVGTGLVNYYFHTKDKLIDEAIRFFLTREVISGWEGQLLFRPKKPAVLIKEMLKSFADFMADFPRISRISILNDLNSPGEGDNTLQTVKGITPYIQEALGRNEKNGKSFRIAWIIVAAIQTVFMRSELFAVGGGFDFFRKDERDNFIDDIVETYIR